MGIDTGKRYVRVRNLRDDGFVEFDFAMGEPELFVELVLRPEAFDEFCAANKVRFLSPEGEGEGDRENDWAWRLADARETRFR
ncbi:phenol hydroxylase subunit [Zavarzinia compransoris]|uniref:Phenol hydroxylase n=1 Tax=Zavarzinia compransoris TaxID=1264899 RepID=A0A317ECT6_9PROT|nr:phenol hydroxylase subunit [Zavarzinia compransoris]PWR23173.1 phenol hydroxylase [Zavarzinia compransoris]TDP46269.1 phenol 2-monooxygenase P0 subunit [Zavarzinia compransoris]